jgi:hypothetical protein
VSSGQRRWRIRVTRARARCWLGSAARRSTGRMPELCQPSRKAASTRNSLPSVNRHSFCSHTNPTAFQARLPRRAWDSQLSITPMLPDEHPMESHDRRQALLDEAPECMSPSRPVHVPGTPRNLGIEWHGQPRNRLRHLRHSGTHLVHRPCALTDSSHQRLLEPHPPPIERRKSRTHSSPMIHHVSQHFFSSPGASRSPFPARYFHDSLHACTVSHCRDPVCQRCCLCFAIASRLRPRHRHANRSSVTPSTTEPQDCDTRLAARRRGGSAVPGARAGKRTT